MSRWNIERSGTGVERSGTGVEKSGTGIERSGTGIERSGTGIERSGTGIKKVSRVVRGFALAGMLVIPTLPISASAGAENPAGALQIVVNEGTLAVSWIFDGSVFSGVTPTNGSFVALVLTEVAMSDPVASVQVTGGGTGSSVQVTGGGTGSSVQVTGGGTGSSVQVTGGGTGSSVQVTGGGTGGRTLVTGGGTGASVQVTGGGTGGSTLVTGGGTGGSVRSSEPGTSSITITPPENTGLSMEVSLGCGSASVSILDASSLPLATFSNVPVIGDTGLCSTSAYGAAFTQSPGGDFRIQ